MTSQCVDFTGLEDGNNNELDENFTVSLTSSDNVNLNLDMAVITINGAAILINCCDDILL